MQWNKVDKAHIVLIDNLIERQNFVFPKLFGKSFSCYDS